MLVRTPKMARPAQATPRGHRDVLSAASLLRSSIRPMIATRSGEGRSRLTEEEETARLSHIRYTQRMSSALSTPRNMYDAEDSSTLGPASYDSQTADVTLHSGGHRTYHPRPSLEPADDRVAVVGGNGRRDYPRGLNGYRHHHHHHHHQDRDGRRRRGRRGHVRPVRGRRGVALMAPTCYIFLKVLEMLSCIVILVVSRMLHEDLPEDYVYSILAACALFTAGIGLLVIWVRGHPGPDDCVHTTMLLLYCLTAPTLTCGGILVLLLSATANDTVIITASLFFFSAVLFSADMLVMASSILQFQCCCCCLCFTPSPPPRHPHRVHPTTHTHPHYYHQDYYGGRHSYPRGYPYNDPWRDRPGPYSKTYPRSLPQMTTVRS